MGQENTNNCAGFTSLYAQVLQREKDIPVVVSEWISDSLFNTSWLICIRKRCIRGCCLNACIDVCKCCIQYLLMGLPQDNNAVVHSLFGGVWRTHWLKLCSVPVHRTSLRNTGASSASKGLSIIASGT